MRSENPSRSTHSTSRARKHISSRENSAHLHPVSLALSRYRVIALSRYHCRKGNQQAERTWDAHDSTSRPIRQDRRCTRLPRIALLDQHREETVKRGERGARARSIARSSAVSAWLSAPVDGGLDVHVETPSSSGWLVPHLARWPIDR